MRYLFVLLLSAAAFITACGGSPTQVSTKADTLPRSSSQETSITRDQIIEARRNFSVKVLSFDASQRFGTKQPYADFVRLQITNGSTVTLPCLTVLTKRYVGNQMAGSSRRPSIPTRDLKPGQSVEYDYYPVGHLDVANVDRIEVEIEGIIEPDSERFFCELNGG